MIACVWWTIKATQFDWSNFLTALQGLGVPASEWTCVFLCRYSTGHKYLPGRKDSRPESCSFLCIRVCCLCFSVRARKQKYRKPVKIKGLNKPEKILCIHTEWEYHSANQQLFPFSDQGWFLQTFCQLQTNTSTNQSTSTPCPSLTATLWTINCTNSPTDILKYVYNQPRQF